MFEFEAVAGAKHPLHLTHVMRARSKRCVPILAGAPPPKPPKHFTTAKHMAEADKFAQYMLTLFCPWDLHTG